MKFSTISAATAAFFTSASAVSTVAIVNRCPHTLYLWSVEGGQAPSQMYTLPAGNPQIGYSEKYRYVSEYAGVSLKIAPYYSPGGVPPPPDMNITQIEYTVPDPAKGDPNIWYDLSFVNGNSLEGIPFTYSPSSPMAPNCMAGSCSGDYAFCNAGYNYWNDDSHTHACPFEQDLVVTFCDGNAASPLRGPTGELGSNSKREVQPEPVPEPQVIDGDGAVCISEAAGDAVNGVAVFAGLCAESTPAVTPTPLSTVAPAASAPVALQQPAQAQTTTSSSSTSSSTTSTVAPASSTAAAAPPAAAPASPPTSPLSQLQLSSIANTGVTCWLSVQSGNTCTPITKRDASEKRDAHAHSHRHNHQEFHRRNRIIRSAA